MEQHTQIRSRQCKGLSDPEGVQPSADTVTTPDTVTACDEGPQRGATKFDNPGPNVEGQGPMEEEHTSRTR